LSYGITEVQLKGEDDVWLWVWVLENDKVVGRVLNWRRQVEIPTEPKSAECQPIWLILLNALAIKVDCKRKNQLLNKWRTCVKYTTDGGRRNLLAGRWWLRVGQGVVSTKVALAQAAGAKGTYT
jgi:hypothetical protein